MLEREDHLGGFHIRVQVDHVTAFAARLAEQTPRDCIQQRRLPRAVVPGDARKIERVEIQFNGIAIRKKT